ncbi:hypothetical protein ACN2C7_15800 [Caulobacter sp. ErkDOM-E]|uniref:hypothetical protein n=1 Tax=Caulobacter sp. ErkDOM-E TaxID=3402778 RepID=UPI003AF46906
MKGFTVLAGAITAALIAGVASAAEDPKEGFTIEPKVLDSSADAGATVALEYAYQKTFKLKDLSSSDRGNALPDPTPSRGAVTFSVDGSGTATADAERNPKNFLDLSLGLNIDWDPGYETGWGRLLVGGFVKGETDQGFENEQVVWGARGSYGQRDLLASNDFLGLDLKYGLVEPGEDKERQKALGVTDLDDYERLDIEALYMFRTGWDMVPTIEFNYRLFKELDAPTVIKAVDLDLHQLATVRFGLGKDLFVGYSTGKLPFDRKDDQTLEIGFSYKLF